MDDVMRIMTCEIHLCIDLKSTGSAVVDMDHYGYDYLEPGRWTAVSTCETNKLTQIWVTK